MPRAPSRKPRKVLINNAPYGFGLSYEAVVEMLNLDFNRNQPWRNIRLRPRAERKEYGYFIQCDRAHPDVIAAVERVGLEVASPTKCKLQIFDIGTDYYKVSVDDKGCEFLQTSRTQEDGFI
jgi:hypothetical protein